MTQQPRVSVLMPAYDRERYIGDAIASVLAQTFEDFELLVVDDGSTDRTAEIAAGTGDPRVRLLQNETNLGIPATRNRGIEAARGEFVAMLDSDDRAEPTRLAKQVRFLDRHPSHALVGTWFRYMDSEGKPGRMGKRPVHAKALRARLLFIGCYRNTTVMARRAVLEGYSFRDEFQVAEDLDLWTRISLDHDGANLPEVLVHYRRHEGGISRERKELGRRMKMKIAAHQLESLGVAHREVDLARHVDLRRPHRLERSRETFEWAAQWLEELRQANRRMRIYPEPHFGFAVAERWSELMKHLRRGEPDLGLGRNRLDRDARLARWAAKLGWF